ncbi:hypothetical protein [Streptomyces sp. NPDC089915]|uniref:hypothetical protein n=1 Tax=Streptomyces sp. NPDC089915 TaxID=3155186 RepID=UPI0034378E3E
MTQNQYGQPTPPPTKPPMGKGKKIALGCGGSLVGGLVLLIALGLALGPADDTDAKAKPKAAPKPSATRPVATLSGINLTAWAAALEGQGIKFESKGEQYTPPGGPEAFKDWKGKSQRSTQEGLYLKATAIAYASDGAVMNASCKAQEATGQETKVTGFFEKCVTALAVPGMDAAQATAFVKENTARLIAAASTPPAYLNTEGVTLRIDDDGQAGAAQLTITAKR